MGNMIANEMTNDWDLVIKLISLSQKNDFRLESDLKAVFYQMRFLDPFNESFTYINFRITIKMGKHFHDLTLSEIRQ